MYTLLSVSVVWRLLSVVFRVFSLVLLLPEWHAGSPILQIRCSLTLPGLRLRRGTYRSQMQLQMQPRHSQRAASCLGKGFFSIFRILICSTPVSVGLMCGSRGFSLLSTPLFSICPFRDYNFAYTRTPPYPDNLIECYVMKPWHDGCFQRGGSIN